MLVDSPGGLGGLTGFQVVDVPNVSFIWTESAPCHLRSEPKMLAEDSTHALILRMNLFLERRVLMCG